MANIVIMGGGTAMNLVLSGLKKYNHRLTAIISMVSSGGSTGRLRDSLGVSPVGNIRQCLLALSEKDEFNKKLMNYRFDAGELKGHNFGNICLAALEKLSGNVRGAIAFASNYLNVKGNIIPATAVGTDLCAELDHGEIIYGESCIDQPRHNKDFNIVNIFLEPSVTITPDAREAILKADLIIIGPGDFYNILSYFLVTGLPEAISESKAKKTYVCNFINRHGATNNYRLINYVKHIEKYLGQGVIDYYIYNTKRLNNKMLKLCSEREETFVEHSEEDCEGKNYKIIKEELLSDEIYFSSHVDQVQRSCIRHDKDKLAQIFNDLVTSEKYG